VLHPVEELLLVVFTVVHMASSRSSLLLFKEGGNEEEKDKIQYRNNGAIEFNQIAYHGRSEGMGRKPVRIGSTK
jgi:hypothetical protein